MNYISWGRYLVYEDPEEEEFELKISRIGNETHSVHTRTQGTVRRGRGKAKVALE
jgi:hypothetical protein